MSTTAARELTIDEATAKLLEISNPDHQPAHYAEAFDVANRALIKGLIVPELRARADKWQQAVLTAASDLPMSATRGHLAQLSQGYAAVVDVLTPGDVPALVSAYVENFEGTGWADNPNIPAMIAELEDLLRRAGIDPEKVTRYELEDYDDSQILNPIIIRNSDDAGYY